MASWQKLLWIIGCMSLNLVFEGLRPFFKGGYRKWPHTRTNLIFLATTMAINSAFGVIAVGGFHWGANAQVGLLHWVDWSTGLELLLAIVVFDFIAQFSVHWCLHNVPFLWLSLIHI